MAKEASMNLREKQRKDAAMIVRILDFLDKNQGSTSIEIQENVTPKRSLVQIRELLRKGGEIGDIKRIGEKRAAKYFTRKGSSLLIW